MDQSQSQPCVWIQLGLVLSQEGMTLKSGSGTLPGWTPVSSPSELSNHVRGNVFIYDFMVSQTPSPRSIAPPLSAQPYPFSLALILRPVTSAPFILPATQPLLFYPSTVPIPQCNKESDNIGSDPINPTPLKNHRVSSPLIQLAPVPFLIIRGKKMQFTILHQIDLSLLPATHLSSDYLIPFVPPLSCNSPNFLLPLAPPLSSH